MKNNLDQLSPKENIQADNALKALNLELNYGAMHTFISDDCPPEFASQWLDNVTAYEAQYAQADMISVHEFIGAPAILPAGTFPKQKIESEIERLTALLEQHCIMTDRPEHRSPAAYYRFLSEEFMQHQMPNITVPGMMHMFPYIDFYRDAPEYLEGNVGDFIQDLMGLDRPYSGLWLSENLRDDLHMITKAQALDRIQNFRASYQNIELGAFSPIKLERSEYGHHFLFHAEWFGTPVQKGRAKEHHEGLSVIQVALEDGDWLIQGVMMPGFKF